MKTSSYLMILVIILPLACAEKISTKPGSAPLDFHPDKSSFISFANELDIPKKGGHIQGVQYYREDENSYFFFTGSSTNQSYLAIADAQSQEIISVQKLMDEPFRHAGGFQIMDRLLFVGIEDNEEKDKSLIQIYQIEGAKEGKLRLLKSIKRQGKYKRVTAGSVAVTKVKDSIWICVGNWDNHDLDVYKIALDQPQMSEVDAKIIYSINSENLDRNRWVEKSWFSYQNINFFWEEEQLFMAAMAEERLGGKQLLDIFSCDLEKEDLALEKVFHQNFPKKGDTGFRWGGGVYRDEKGNLKVMACGEQIKETIAVRIY
ncbi:MAG: hypothetical protein AAFR87_05235 [Bacteroidota bacterium]